MVLRPIITKYIIPETFLHYTGVPVLAGSYSKELEDFVGAKFYYPHALADSNQCIQIRQKMPEFSSTPSPYRPYLCSTLYYRVTTLCHTILLLHPFNGLFSRTTWISRHQKGKTSLDLNEARDDGVLDAVASAGPYANNLHLADNHTKSTSLNFSDWMHFLTPIKHCQSTDGIDIPCNEIKLKIKWQ